MKCYILAIYGKKIDISGEFVFGYEGTLFGKTFDITNNTIILDENDNNISVSEFIYQKYEPILLWATGEKVKKIKLFRIIQLKDQELDQLINALNLSKKDIKKIQVLLEKLGYKPGIPDGILGLNTKRSIKSFLENHYDGITALNELILNLEFASKPRNLTLNDEAEEKDINMVLYELRNPKDGYAKAVGGCRADIPKEYLKKINKSIESLLKSIPPGNLKIMVMTEDSEIFTTSLIDIVD